MKKIISMILAVMLILGATSTAVFAKNEKKNNGKGKVSAKLFEDSDEVSWAQKAIDKLKLKGLVKGDNGKYQPNRSVTHLEAIIMSLRIMDWEPEALALKSLPKNYKGDEVKNWAVGYINMAYQKGILDETDLNEFNPNKPVKRHEIAKYIIKALDKEDEAKAKMNADLPFVDAAAVPQGSVGYVYMINDLGIMKGDGKRFNPMSTLSRAEMAMLFYNLDERVDNDYDFDEFRGIVDSVTSDKIVLKISAFSRSFDVSDDVVVYKAASRVPYSTIVKGAKILLKTEDDVVEYIEILNDNQPDDKIITNYTGELKAIGSGNPMTLTVKIEELTAIFKVANGAEFYFKGVKGTISDLKVGDEVKIAVDNHERALKVVVDRVMPIVTQDEGIMTDIDLDGPTYHIMIDNRIYNLSKDAQAKIGNTLVDLDELVAGRITKVLLQQSVVESVYQNY